MIVADGRADQTELEFLKEAINFLDKKRRDQSDNGHCKKWHAPGVKPT